MTETENKKETPRRNGPVIVRGISPEAEVSLRWERFMKEEVFEAGMKDCGGYGGDSGKSTARRCGGKTQTGTERLG